MIHLATLSMLKDNLSYLIWSDQTRHAVAIDPSEAKPVLTYLQTHSLKLAGILNTHHHWDHVGGNAELFQQTGCTVHCSKTDLSRIPNATKGYENNDCFRFQDADDCIELRVIAIPGHTKGQIAYHEERKNWLFVGDTLFSLGCGRIYEGSPEELFASLQNLSILPDPTRVYFGHEYTASNARFSIDIFPEEKVRFEKRLQQAKDALVDGQAGLAPTLGEEKSLNLFLRTHEPRLKHALNIAEASDLECFKVLRSRRDVL